MTQDDYAFAERCAILEFDAGFTREEAEARARAMILKPKPPEMKTNVAPSSVSAYYHSDYQPERGAQRDEVLAILRGSPAPMTLAEITAEINKRYAVKETIPDSSISGRLNELKDGGAITDENPKRKCRVNPKMMKKTWRVRRSSDMEQVSLI